MDERKINKLKSALAKIVGCKDADIDDSFSLDLPKFKSSAGSVILANVVKKIYKEKIDCSNVKTFGALLARVEGGAEPSVETIECAEMAEPEKAPPEKTEPPASAPQPSLFQLHCGVDIQDIAIFPETNDYWTEPFYKEHFTAEEIAYCATTDFPRQHFASRWCVKEALVKCGLTAPFNRIQIKKLPGGGIRPETLAPNGAWSALDASCSMSHSEAYAVGMAVVTGVCG
jgi:phosphopantetheine--protein transferase-like protein